MLPRSYEAFARGAIRMVAKGEYRKDGRRKQSFERMFGQTPVEADTLESYDLEEVMS